MFFLFFTCFVLVYADPTNRVLIPDQPLENEIIIPGNSIIYEITSLDPNSHYEIRISYPATVRVHFCLIFAKSPTNFQLSFISSPQVGRQLLNIEKIMFKTDESGKILVCHICFMLMLQRGKSLKTTEVI